MRESSHKVQREKPLFKPPFQQPRAYMNSSACQLMPVESDALYAICNAKVSWDRSHATKDQ